jgi:hypothetical protein
MAMKLGAENKRNVVIAGVLFCVVAGLVIYQFVGGPSTPPPPAPTTPVVVSQAHTASGAATTVASTNANGPAARKVNGANLDPALHLEKLELSESIEYAGSGRNIFSADSAPVAIETAKAGPRPSGPAQVAAYVPPPVPQPPAIDLRYFGYSATREGKRKAFLLHGDDIFEAAAGDIVNHRYKVVAVDQHSIQVTDLSYNNTQTLQLAN